MRPLLLACAVLAALAPPAAAVEVTATDADGGVFLISVIDDTGRPNGLLVREERGRIIVRDRGDDAVRSGEGCRALDLRSAACAAAADERVIAISGGDGDDEIVVQAAARTSRIRVAGGEGDDSITAIGSRAALSGGPGADRLQGGAGDDDLTGGAGPDRLGGGGGDDQLTGDGRPEAGVARDLLDGGPGDDEASWFSRASPVLVDLRSDAPAGATGERDRLRRVEGAIGGSGDDRLVGNGGSNRLIGGDGADRVIGGGGDDVLAINHWGRVPLDDGDADRVRCGAGADVLYDPLAKALVRSCERVASAQYGLYGRTLAVHPARVGAGRLRFELLGPPDTAVTRATRRIVLTARGRVVGRSRVVRLRRERGTVALRLRRRLAPGTVVRVAMVGRDDPSDRTAAAFRFAWRIRL
ncbi:MAG TPA: calcium-binding protein [Solirubrobacteraceae bacterium]|jgi:Ca2+-binding RTX toxin-like protein